MRGIAVSGDCERDDEMNPQSLTVAGFVLGIGAAGFFDGIVLHQLLQWHHFVSNVYPMTTVEGLELNTLWDGIFHSATYVISIIGLVLLWRVISRQTAPLSGRTLFGAMLLGAGTFHVFDAIVNHWLLGIHHIRSGPDQTAYDLGFFAIGIALVIIGAAVKRSARTFPTLNRGLENKS
jgi:uncharacterized membrane protein